jgi:alkylation response protein AidB-like acyl-CoA dehydrogenase
MATLVLDDEQRMLREAAERFMADKAPVAQLRGLRDAEDRDGFDRATWAEMAEMGFAGALIDEAHGGTGFGHVAMGQVMEAGGRTLAASPLFASAVVGASAVALAGSEAQQAAWLPKIAAGELLCALAVDEGKRHAPGVAETEAAPDGEGWVLTGRKANVADGHVAGLILVSARTPDGIGLFAVEAGAKGLEVERTVMVDSRNAAIVRLERTPAVALGDPGQGAEALARVLDIANAHLAAELLGIAQEAFARTNAYLGERKQFGVTIGSFQALQHRASHLFSEIELAKSAVMAALSALDEGAAEAPLLASVAKAKAAGVADLATNEGVQMHGGIGMTDAVDIGLFLKRARPAAQLFGDERYHADRFARLSGF